VSCLCVLFIFSLLSLCPISVSFHFSLSLCPLSISYHCPLSLYPISVSYHSTLSLCPLSVSYRCSLSFVPDFSLSSVLVLNALCPCPKCPLSLSSILYHCLLSLSSVIVLCPYPLSMSSVLVSYYCLSLIVFCPGGGYVMCMCICTKRVCVCNKEPNRCTVGVYSTEESRYLYSLGEYICLLFTFKKFSIHLIYFYKFKSTLQAKFSCKEYNLIKVYNKL